MLLILIVLLTSSIVNVDSVVTKQRDQLALVPSASTSTLPVHSISAGPVVLITGANRGIGLGLVMKYLSEPGIKVVFATCRDPERMTELRKLAALRDRMKLTWPILELVKMDVTTDRSIDKAVRLVRNRLYHFHKRGLIESPALNLLINNAGIMKKHDSERMRVSALEADRSHYLEHFNVNTLGAISTTVKFMPLIAGSPSENMYNMAPEGTKSGVIFISSSISSTNAYLGPRYHDNVAYEASKAATNHYMKALSAYASEWLITISICPGWVDTDMGRIVPATAARGISPLTVEECSTKLVERIAQLNTNDSGNFYSPLTTDAPWMVPYPF